MELQIEISITRALAELATLKKRITKLSSNTTFISTKVSGRSWTDHLNDSKAAWQSINDLMARYQAIKFAVLESNSSTRVTISDKSYSVAEAIATKECMVQKRAFLDDLRRQRQTIAGQVQTHESGVQHQLNSLLETSFKNDKSGGGDIKVVSDAYLKNNRIEVMDPLGLDKKITELDNEILSFTSEVDFVLSESNSTVRIRV